MILSYKMGEEKNVKFIYIQELPLESQSNKSFTDQQLVDHDNDFISNITKFRLTFQSKAFKISNMRIEKNQVEIWQLQKKWYKWYKRNKDFSSDDRSDEKCNEKVVLLELSHYIKSLSQGAAHQRHHAQGSQTNNAP